jgi:hypothetical protein
MVIYIDTAYCNSVSGYSNRSMLSNPYPRTLDRLIHVDVASSSGMSSLIDFYLNRIEFSKKYFFNNLEIYLINLISLEKIYLPIIVVII